MPSRPQRHTAPGAQTKRERDKDHDKRRGSAASRGYGSKWRKARADFLVEHPLCERCTSIGRVTEATVVHHRIAHKGDLKLFWSRSNWEAICKPHHDRDAQSEEKGGAPRVTIGTDGWPIEASDH